MRVRLRSRALVLACVMTLTSVSVPLVGCAGNPPPKVVVATADRAAYQALRGFQIAEEQAWHAKMAWPTEEQHKTINTKVSQAYQLIIDVANLGIALPPGGTLSAADLAIIGNLVQIVADIVTLARGGDATVQTAATNAQQKAQALATKVQGARP